MLVALAITEDLVADTYDRMAAARDDHADAYRLHAKRARAAADECRGFSARVAELHPHGEPPQATPLHPI